MMEMDTCVGGSNVSLKKQLEKFVILTCIIFYCVQFKLYEQYLSVKVRIKVVLCGCNVICMMDLFTHKLYDELESHFEISFSFYFLIEPIHVVQQNPFVKDYSHHQG